MKNSYKKLERIFEKICIIITFILGNSITFIVALIIIIGWITKNIYMQQDLNETLRDVIIGLTFLSLFIIQKSFSRFTSSLNIKVNELIYSSDKANNEVLIAETKSEHDLNILTKEYSEINANLEEIEDLIDKKIK